MKEENVVVRMSPLFVSVMNRMFRAQTGCPPGAGPLSLVNRSFDKNGLHWARFLFFFPLHGNMLHLFRVFFYSPCNMDEDLIIMCFDHLIYIHKLKILVNS